MESVNSGVPPSVVQQPRFGSEVVKSLVMTLADKVSKVWSDKAEFYEMAAEHVAPFSSELAARFQVLRLHAILTKSQFGANQLGGTVLGTARNVARTEVIRDRKDYEATMELLDQCDQLTPKEKEQIKATNRLHVTSAISNGICMGIRLNTAQRYFAGESVPDIIRSNESGAPAEAAANQALFYAIAQRGVPRETTIISFLNSLNSTQTQNRPDSLKGVSVNAVLEKWGKNREILGNAFIKLKQNGTHPWLAHDPNKKPPFLIKDAEALKAEFINDGLTQNEATVLASCFIYLLAPKQQETRLPHTPQPKTEKTSFFSSILGRAQQIFDTKTPKESFDDFSNITDPSIRFAMLQTAKQLQNNREEFVANTRGLTLGDNIDQSSFYDSDRAFLSNTPRLPPGVYAINIETATSIHSITLVKNKDGSAYILDPNHRQLQVTSDEIVDTLTNLVNTYPQPENKPPHAGDNPHHLLRIRPIRQRTTT